ncbi:MULTISPECIES: hypothetical protein [Cysteiniphilum]|uniref:Uncharacterized protein n=1 Tax=Cysteiniphilum litorale TaxID=2056700 RepID=A0A8J2Z317_9GAMM|nr:MULTISPECIES: hypothetical protein [Cysteiniphilum]GGF91958.1 hypothetical protein GCM10010995_06380 [Cysteiniphilum litorale]
MQQIKLSDIENDLYTNEDAHHIYIDQDSCHIPTNLNNASFLLTEEFCDRTQISEVYLDVILNYKNSGVKEVTMEISYESLLLLDLDEIILMMLSLDVNASLLPPSSEDNIIQYIDYLKKLTRKWLEAKSMRGMLLPVANYYIYIVGNLLGYKPEKITSCNYMDTVFTQDNFLKHMDLVKSAIEDVVYEFMGGEAGIKSYINSIGVAFKKTVEEELPKLFGDIK